MYCKYCGKEIDNDSVYCRHCGKNISKESTSFLYKIDNASKPAQKLIQKTFNKVPLYKVGGIIKPKLIFTWKVLQTIVLWIMGILMWLIIGFLYSPLIALFNADMPRIGIFDQIDKIWKKEEKKEEDKPLEDYFDF